MAVYVCVMCMDFKANFFFHSIFIKNLLMRQKLHSMKYVSKLAIPLKCKHPQRGLLMNML